MEVKRILVTGGAGFIGHHFLRRLLKHPEYEIISLDRLDFSGNLNRIAELAQEFGPEEMRRLRVIFHDLRAEINGQIAKQIGDLDYIVHMAAGSHVNRSIANPLQFVQDNVVGTAHLLEFARHHQPNLKKFINFGTDEVFGDAPDNVEYHEWSRYNSRSPYSATKAGAEELCIAYENTYKMPIYVTHTMNVFGERQLPEKFLGIIMRQLLDDKPVVIHCDAETGTRSGLRHWIHAADVADATMFIINLPHGEFPIAPDEGGGTCPKFNIVGDREYSNLEVAEHVAMIMGRKLKTEMVSYDLQRPGHDFRYALSGAYMKSLGWIPSQDFETRLTQMVNWTLKNSRWLKL
jgi:dTDP-glucose 4,6-dehydratase